MTHTRDFFCDTWETPKEKPKEKPKPIPRVRHDDSPSGRAERLLICKFLTDNGHEDLFNTPIYSNYQLQMLAALKYGWIKPEGMI